MALKRSYLLLRLYAPELDLLIITTGNQILAVWRECDGVDVMTVAYKIWVSPIFQISQISINELTVIQPSLSYYRVIHFCSCKFAFKDFFKNFFDFNYSIISKIKAIIIYFYSIYSL
jgi:hypothetical protein